MKPRICECCGQVIAPVWDAGGPVKQRIYDLIRKHPGLDSYQITERIYQGDGPESVNVVSVHVNQINKRLVSQGLVIRGNNKWGGYRIKAL